MAAKCIVGQDRVASPQLRGGSRGSNACLCFRRRLPTGSSGEYQDRIYALARFAIRRAQRMIGRTE